MRHGRLLLILVGPAFVAARGVNIRDSARQKMHASLLIEVSKLVKCHEDASDEWLRFFIQSREEPFRLILGCSDAEENANRAFLFPYETTIASPSLIAYAWTAYSLNDLEAYQHSNSSFQKDSQFVSCMKARHCWKISALLCGPTVVSSM